MVVVDRKYNGAAAQATLQTTMTATTPGAGGTIVVSDDSGYPSTGKFSITIDRGQAGQEHVLINSRSGTTFTIGSRAYDDSVASAHTSGEALVEHWFAARDAQLFVDHVDDVESDPHSTKLLNNARHDLEARHQFGGAYGTPVTPTALTPDIAGAAGTGNNPSREDHVHNVPAATATSITGANAEGSSGSFARADHDHDLAANAIGSVTDIAAAVRDILVPPGTIVAYGDAAAPTGWLLCNGAAVSRSTFATLFGVLGTDFGAGDGSTTFNVPDLRQRFPLGKAASGTGVTLGSTGGAIDHDHALDTSSSHARWNQSGTVSHALRKSTAAWNETIEVTGAGTVGASSASQALGISLGGDSDTENPPFQVVQYIIRTGNTS